MAKLGDLIVNIGGNAKDLNDELGKVRREMKRFGSNFKSLGRDLTRSVTLPLAAIGAAAIKSAADLETLEVSFISLTGGAEQASAMMAQLNDFTAKTPFQIDAVATSARQLIASGTDISQVNDQLQFLGDIAATSGSSIDEIAAIFSKVQAKGKVELESLNQLAERGIPIFTALSEATGLPASELGAGRVSVEQFNEVLKSFAEEGGFAAGAMERLSETTAGKFSTALDNLKLAGAELVQSLMPVIKQLIDGVTALAQRFAKASPEFKKATLLIGGIVAAIGPLLVILPTLGGALSAAFAAATGPIGLVIAGIAALTTAFFYFFDDIKGPLVDVINYFIDLYNNSVIFRGGIQMIILTFKNWWAYVKFFFNSFVGLAGVVLDYVGDQFTALGDIVMGIFTRDLELIKKGAKGMADVFTGSFTDGFDVVKENASILGEEVAENFQDAVTNTLEAEPIEYVTTQDLDAAKDKILGLLDFSSWFEGVGSSATTAAEGVDTLLDKLNNVATTSPLEGLFNDLNGIKAIEEEIIETTDSLSGTFEQFSNQMGGAFAEAIVEGNNFGETIIQVGKQILKSLLSQAIANAIANASSSKNLANQASGGLSIPAFIAAAVASVKKAFGNVPALAEGGLAFGETMSIVGDNRNAAIDPEVIAPLSKLKDFMGGEGTQVYGRISGDDIVISNRRAERDRNRFS
jgi:tape measure domain-containing protein